MDRLFIHTELKFKCINDFSRHLQADIIWKNSKDIRKIMIYFLNMFSGLSKNTSGLFQG